MIIRRFVSPLPVGGWGRLIRFGEQRGGRDIYPNSDGVFEVYQDEKVSSEVEMICGIVVDVIYKILHEVLKCSFHLVVFLSLLSPC